MSSIIYFLWLHDILLAHFSDEEGQVSNLMWVTQPVSNNAQWETKSHDLKAMFSLSSPLLPNFLLLTPREINLIYAFIIKEVSASGSVKLCSWPQVQNQVESEHQKNKLINYVCTSLLLIKFIPGITMTERCQD